ncbi:MAG TPA: MoaD family protein [Candidatus Limnocylindrales bacterium]|nr:MoaD family protein [Candidatus Limnocylindrales bacterium]
MSSTSPGAEPGSAAARLRIHVRLFAMQRELAGTRTLDVEVSPGATIDDAWAALVARFPVLAPGRPAVRFAHNGAYAPATTPLADGDEVAMIPPVSGGAGEPAGDRGAGPSGDRGAGPAAGHGEAGPARDREADSAALPASAVRIIEIQEAAFAPTVLADLSARLASPEDGAVVGFLGVTRRSPGTPAPGQEAAAAAHAGRAVTSLEYEALPELARKVMAEIADEIAARFGVERLAIVHRTGEVPLGEASVAIVACSPHRDAAFEAARYAIDETKGRAPIWKAERFSDGKVWIGEPARSGPAEG